MVVRWLRHGLPGGVGALLVALLAIMPRSGAAAEAGAPPEDLVSIKERGVLRIAITNFDIPPFHQRRSDGSFVGRDIEFANELGTALKVKIVFDDKPPTFDAVIQEVASGRADIGLSKLSQTYDRVANVRFSVPYVTLRHALLYNRAVIAGLSNGAAPEVALRSFAGKIGVIAASAYVDFATADYPHADVVPIDTWDDTIKSLEEGKVDIVYRDEFEIRSVLIQDPSLHIGYGAAVMSDRTSFLAMAICDSCVKLEEFINFFIEQHPRAYSLDDLLTAHYAP